MGGVTPFNKALHVLFILRFGIMEAVFSVLVLNIFTRLILSIAVKRTSGLNPAIFSHPKKSLE